MQHIICITLYVYTIIYKNIHQLWAVPTVKIFHTYIHFIFICLQYPGYDCIQYVEGITGEF